jgi:ATP-dependent DNA helicase RecG
MFLEQSIDKLPSTSQTTIKRFKKIGIKTFFDLLNYFPFRYENYSLISFIEKAQPGEKITLKGKIIDKKEERTKKGLRLQKFLLYDGTGKIEIIFYNQPYLLKVIPFEKEVSFAGEVNEFGKKIIMTPFEWEVETNIHTGRLVPIYPEKKGLSSRVIREKIFWLLSQISENEILEIFPKEIISYNNLLSEYLAYKNIHFPKNRELAEKSKKRLAFDELFVIQLSAFLVKKEWEKEKVGHQFLVSNKNLTRFLDFIKNLPFQLTEAQKRVIKEILNDLEKEKPMNRFLQGDVGSGKTVVAACLCYLAYLNGFQSLFMAPTEILAKQHFQTLSSLFKNYPVKIGLQTRTEKINKKRKDNEVIFDFDIIVGTHALLNEKLKFSRVGLVIIDEQHRFGVRQRALLKEKGLNPHLLTMTATPIPRTVALVLYGELDISYLDEMPKGRLPVKTYLVPQEKREKAYQWIKEKIKNENASVFIVCPLIDESEVETMKSVKAAKKEFENLKKIFSEFKLGLLHGKLKNEEKNKVLLDFRNDKIKILVTTPVVEVGIDIPQATIMVIEAAERFGLAQLHQLRGRVGRSNKQSYCFLFTTSNTPEVIERLTFFSKTNLGIKLAEYDLQTRGPGEIYGEKQHGFINLKVASFTDYELISKTKNAVNYFVAHYQLSQFPLLSQKIKEYQIKQITRD